MGAAAGAHFVDVGFERADQAQFFAFSLVSVPGGCVVSTLAPAVLASFAVPRRNERAYWSWVSFSGSLAT